MRIPLSVSFLTSLLSLISLPTQLLGADLLSKVRKAEVVLESNFRSTGLITAIDTTGGQKSREWSARWSGYYLASQCLKYQHSPSTLDRIASYNRIQSIVKSIEDLFEVTGAPTGMARAIVPNSVVTDSLATTEVRWHEGEVKSYPKLKWLSGAELPDYHAVLFGLTICSRQEGLQGIKQNVSSRILKTIIALMNFDWKIPGPEKSTVINAEYKLSWAILALDQGPKDLGTIERLNQAIDRAYGEIEIRSLIETIEIKNFKFELARVHNYSDYWTWADRYLAYLLIGKASSAPDQVRNLISLVINKKMWPFSWDHHNPIFTFTKQLTVGETNPYQDQIAIKSAVKSLEDLADQDRHDHFVSQSGRIGQDLSRDQIAYTLSLFKGAAQLLSDLLKVDLTWLGKVNADTASTPLEQFERPPSPYFWSDSPFVLSGGGDGTTEYPPVDLILGYWLGIDAGASVTEVQAHTSK